jgi:hypothetical protein
MGAPYNPGPGENPPGQQPQWGGYPDGGNYPPQNPPGHPDQGGYPDQGGFSQPSYQGGGYQQGGYPQGGYQQGGYQQGGYPQQGGYAQPGGSPYQGGYQQGGYPPQRSGYDYQQQPQSPQERAWRSRYDEPSESAGIAGLALAAVGALLLVVGIAALDWYSLSGQGIKFNDLHDAAKHGNVGLMKAYGGFLAWILVVVVVVAAVLASLPIGAGGAACRVITPIVGALGIALTLVALNSFWTKDRKAGEAVDVGIFKHASIGLYLTLLGFVVVGIAGVIGPRRA